MLTYFDARATPASAAVCVVTTVASEPKRALEAATLVGNPTLGTTTAFHNGTGN